MSENEQRRRLQRLSTGVPGLDEVLAGGFLQGGVYIIVGPPGAGKTILANQIAYHHGHGSPVAYVTLLAESHSRLLSHLEEMSFFEEGQIAKTVHYLSGYRELEAGGLAALLELLRKEVRDKKATMLIVDGLVSAAAFTESAVGVKKFVHELQTHMGLIGCTALILASGSDPSIGAPEQTMVDGLLDLSNDIVGVRQQRGLHVKKFRGAAHLGGMHSFSITERGITVYPRIESRVTARPIAPTEVAGSLPAGIPGVDHILGGGVDRGAPTLLLGPSGSGKTIFALHFVHAGLVRGERCLFFGFHESPERLVAKARRVGLELQPYVDSGALEIVWHPTVDFLADALAQLILDRVTTAGISRVVVDSLSAFRNAIINKDREGRFFAALSNELNVRGVTSYFLEEATQLFGHDIATPRTGLSAYVDNILLLRQVEMRSVLVRVACALKTRDSEAPALAQFTISKRGVEFGPIDRGVEMILTGSPHLLPAEPPTPKNVPPASKRGRKRPRGR